MSSRTGVLTRGILQRRVSLRCRIAQIPDHAMCMPNKYQQLFSLKMPTNGRPEPEVIVAVRIHLARSFAAPQSNISQFGDGFSYSKTKVEELVKNGFFEKLQKT